MTPSIAKNGRKGQHGKLSGETVSIPLVDLLHDAEAGLLGLSIQVGIRVLQELMEQEGTEIAGPKGRHNPLREPLRNCQLADSRGWAPYPRNARTGEVARNVGLSRV